MAPVTETMPEKTDIVLVAHGTGESSAAAARCAALIAKRRPATRVRAACLKGRPSVAEALSSESVGPVCLVPLLMAEGYSYAALRAQAGAAATGREIAICRPLGTNPGLGELVVQMAAETCEAENWRPADSTLVLVGHGTTRHAASSVSAKAQAARIAARGDFADVVPAFLEEPPDLASVLRGLSSRPVVVAGFFLDSGTHGADDVPRLIAASGVPAVYAGPVGAHPDLAGLILEQAQTAERLRYSG